jgi:hypothetical protein
MLSVVMLSVVMLSVIMLSVVMPSVTMLNVMAPLHTVGIGIGYLVLLEQLGSTMEQRSNNCLNINIFS